MKDELQRMNDALCAFSNRWIVDGDYLRCKRCKRPHLASRAELPYVHESGCRYEADGLPSPWIEFLAILSPLDRSLSAAQPVQPVADESLRKAALSLYEAPFSFQHGYIYDAKHRMVSDSEGQDAAQRIRGWGRISYLPRAEELQDEVGRLVAEALTRYWTAPAQPAPPDRDAERIEWLAARAFYHGKPPEADGTRLWFTPEVDMVSAGQPTADILRAAIDAAMKDAAAPAQDAAE